MRSPVRGWWTSAPRYAAVRGTADPARTVAGVSSTARPRTAPSPPTDDVVGGATTGAVGARDGGSDAVRTPAELGVALATAWHGVDSVLVAFSGGADSALVLAGAVRALGSDRVAAATAVSDAVPGAEVLAARALADRLGVGWHEPRTEEMAREGYRANGGDRCYFCKSELMSVLVPLAHRLGLARVATGTNADDLRAGFRPGIRAATEAGALTPLADAGMTKVEVRSLSAHWGLPTWDKPAAACLSSRIAYGTPITPALLRRVERAEAGVRALLGGLVRDLRVRDLGDGTARVELDAACLDGLDAGAREAVAAEVRGHGHTVVELQAFRSGAMNDLLAAPEAYR